MSVFSSFLVRKNYTRREDFESCPPKWRVLSEFSFQHCPCIQYLSISISYVLSDGATKTLLLNIKMGPQLSVPRNWSLMYWLEYLLCITGLKNSKFHKECISSTYSAFSTQKFCKFCANFSFNLAPKEPNSHQLLSCTSSLNVCTQFVSNVIPSLFNVVCWLQKMSTMRSAQIHLQCKYTTIRLTSLVVYSVCGYLSSVGYHFPWRQHKYERILFSFKKCIAEQRRCSSCHKVSHEKLATLWECNRTNNRNNAP